MHEEFSYYQGFPFCLIPPRYKLLDLYLHVSNFHCCLCFWFNILCMFPICAVQNNTESLCDFIFKTCFHPIGDIYWRAQSKVTVVQLYARLLSDMKGLLGLFLFVCLERRALARKATSFVWKKMESTILFHSEDCNDIDCNPGCFVPQEHDLTLAISQKTTNDGTYLNLINSTGITSCSVNLKATIGQRDWPITCGIMDSPCNFPFNITSCVNSSVVKLECNLQWISSTNCYPVFGLAHFCNIMLQSF